MASVGGATSSFKENKGADPKLAAMKQINRYEVAIAEINSLSSSRTVYQKNGNLYFRTTTQKALASEQKQLDLAKASLAKLTS